MNKSSASLYAFEGQQDLASPQLVYYPALIRQNIQKMIAIAGGADRLWPHIKTHKMAQVVQMQLEAGIDRFKCATIAEAEMAAQAGAKRITLAYPLVGPNIRRFAALQQAFPQVEFFAIGDDTQQIRLLEESLGCTLFDRSTRPVSLTPAGKTFLLDARAILERMSRAAERVHDASTGLTGTLRVGYVRGYERSDLSVLMRRFHQQNGNVLITFYRCSSDTLAAGLMHQKYDIIFTWDSTNLKTQEDISYRTVEKAGLVVAMYAGHPLAQRRQLRRQELRGENILYMSPDAADDSYGDALFMHLYQEAGYKPNILFRSADTESILMMVAAEEGISILPDYCTDKLYNADNLAFVPLVGAGEEEEIIAAWQSGNANPALGRFLAALEGGLQ